MRQRHQKSKSAEEGNESYRNTIIGGVVILAVLVGILFLAYKVKIARNPAEFQGTVVDKSAGYSHAIEGSKPYFRLTVEDGRGQRVTVDVDQHVYHRSQVGTRIKKTQGRIEIEEPAKPAVY